jgi:hypothetical protein
MIVQTVYRHDFIDSPVLRESFTYAGRNALYDMFECLSEDLSDNYYFDPIAIRCSYSEYEDFEEIQADYPQIKDMEDLKNHTDVWEYKMEFIDRTEKGIIIGQF